ncbi:MAG TPA: DUF4230 domain-containing protein [Polyangiaceae bacterium]|nr:DUF4230 domain-containing protein [Polyangiaceae bacterium]
MSITVRETWIAAGAAAVLLAGAVWIGFELGRPRTPLLPAFSSSTAAVRESPNVVAAVQDLARLESVSFRMERVIDLADKQSHLFGLVQAEDAILLVAAADVTAGVDLRRVSERDLLVDAARSRVHLKLPAPEVLSTKLDAEHTYVHTRRTGLLAQRRENLESRARQEAEQRLREAALDAGILERAGDNARRVLTALIQSLGYREVEIEIERTVREPRE